jgi:hypothetical protein
MGKFVANSTTTKAVRKDDVEWLEIIERGGQFELLIKMKESRALDVSFEIDTTLEGIQAKATTVLAMLEAE